MKTSYHTAKFFGLGSILALALGLAPSALRAGPGAQYWNHPAKPVETMQDCNAVKPGDTVVMACGACKTVLVRQAETHGPAGKTWITDWMAIGAEHKCAHCGGTMKVVKGKATDSMQHNCSNCGAGAAFCCVVPAASS